MPLTFGICTDQNRPYEEIVRRWQLFEELGFDSIWVPDHFNQPSRPTGPYFEGWTLLSTLAVVTTKVRVGVLVTSNTFRHPALLAHMAMTVDHISAGRLDLGIGAGWYEPEHHRMGIELPPPATRVARFQEAVEVVDSLLRDDATTFDGEHYQLDGAYLRPGPLQRPRPPLMLAGHRTKMLRICARFADIWNSFGTVAEMRERNELLDEHCADLGRDPANVTRSFYGWASKMEEQGMPDPWSSGDAFEEVVGAYREAGITDFLIDQPADDQMRTLEAVATTALPRLRSVP